MIKRTEGLRKKYITNKFNPYRDKDGSYHLPRGFDLKSLVFDMANVKPKRRRYKRRCNVSYLKELHFTDEEIEIIEQVRKGWYYQLTPSDDVKTMLEVIKRMDHFLSRARIKKGGE